MGHGWANTDGGCPKRRAGRLDLIWIDMTDELNTERLRRLSSHVRDRFEEPPGFLAIAQATGVQERERTIRLAWNTVWKADQVCRVEAIRDH
jgi:hypothetical protein